MKNLNLILLLAASICSNTLFAQESIVFDKQYSFDYGNYIKDFEQTQDGGFICAGGIGFAMFDIRFLLFKTDSYGEVEFCKYQDTPSINSDLFAVGVTKTGNYVGIGKTQENPDWHDSGAIVMYNSNGDTLWSKQYAFDNPTILDMKSYITFYNGICTSDNCILAVGAIRDRDLGNSWPNPLVVKTDIAGDTLWTWRLFNEQNRIVIESVAETKEGDYIAVGSADLPILSQEKNYAPQRGFIVKLSKDGELIFLEEWTDIDFNVFTDVAVNSNNEIVISGAAFRHPPEYPDDSYHSLLVKTDENGETIFYKEIFYGKNMTGTAISVSGSNGICLVSMYESLLGYANWKYDVLCQTFSNSGEILFNKYIGGKFIQNWPYSVISTMDGGFAFCGSYSTDTQVLSWLVKVDSLGNGDYNEGWINSVESIDSEAQIIIYPNPANDKISILLPIQGQFYNACIYNLEGKEIKHFTGCDNTMFVADLCNGIYVIRITTGNQVFNQKIIINH